MNHDTLIKRFIAEAHDPRKHLTSSSMSYRNSILYSYAMPIAIHAPAGWHSLDPAIIVCARSESPSVTTSQHISRASRGGYYGRRLPIGPCLIDAPDGSRISQVISRTRDFKEVFDAVREAYVHKIETDMLTWRPTIIQRIRKASAQFWRNKVIEDWASLTVREAYKSGNPDATLRNVFEMRYKEARGLSVKADCKTLGDCDGRVLEDWTHSGDAIKYYKLLWEYLEKSQYRTPADRAAVRVRKDLQHLHKKVDEFQDQVAKGLVDEVRGLVLKTKSMDLVEHLCAMFGAEGLPLNSKGKVPIWMIRHQVEALFEGRPDDAFKGEALAYLRRSDSTTAQPQSK